MPLHLRPSQLDRRRLLALTAAAAAACGARARAAAAPDVVAFPFLQVRERLVTSVSIEGQGPFPFILDTGDSVVCSISPDLVRRLHLKETGYGLVGGATGLLPSASYRLHDVVIGGALLEHHEVTAIEGPAASGEAGMLPLQLFTSRDTELDFDRSQVRIHLAGRADRSGYAALDAHKLHTQGEAGPIVVRVEVDGVPCTLAVDTGAREVLLYSAFVRRSGLWDRRPRSLPTSVSGIGGHAVAGRVVKVDTLKLGATTFRDPVVTLMDPSAPPTDRSIDGLLGLDLLRRFDFIIGAGGDGLWVRPSGQLTEPFRYDRSGFDAHRRATGEVAITSVAPGGAAEAAGLRVGDALLGLEDPQKLAALAFACRSDPDQQIALEVERAGKVVPVTLVLKDLL